MNRMRSEGLQKANKQHHHKNTKQETNKNTTTTKSHSQGLLGTISNSKQLEVETNKMSALEQFTWLDTQR